MNIIDVDLLIIGAGLAGIGSAVHFKQNFPDKTFAIVEKRSSIGGTWDVFKYPGVRSDSDMFTLGYSFKPWTGSYFATGEQINNYIKETSDEYGITEHIHFNTTASGLEWEDKHWMVYTNKELYRAKFILCATGYINHEHSHHPFIKNRDKFLGKTVHTQYWNNVDYANKNVVVIGSGATAYTLVPELTKAEKHVTVIQRSPTYVRSEQRQPDWLRDLDDRTKARDISIEQQQFYHRTCKDRPAGMKRIIINDVKKRLNSDIDIKHFTPNYMPWDQRVCTTVDYDFLDCINNGSASIETDTIESFTETGVLLASGKTIDADIIVYATGFETRIMGDVSIKVNDKYIDYRQQKVYKGVMIENIPNFGFIFGYASLAWTLKVDLALQYFVRLFNYMDNNVYHECMPYDANNIQGTTGFLDLQSNFYKRNEHMFPRVSDSMPWSINNNYNKDKVLLLEDELDDGMLVWR